MQKDKAVKLAEKKPQVKKEDNKVKLKNKQDKAVRQEHIDEQNSDGSGGAFEEFIDQHHDE
jgi:hypothetical protein